ncbi:MAG: Gfo/Idh/MocA family oxidoreductase [Aliiglaciecola sp.]|uniref:Gfo/Idh/MocA family protein n=1 Tax=Aliiglaciecola sp. M165 TaxID=2593649 RepID=UPI00117DFDA7|nr:Gfo/Idh/MocA family oxidoreductase [Aliiglaciecola sp. M165]TRY30951.1 Gfo/Idh/MocA family oxidoreductase [Aliiglaciecola sp. M165]
MFKKLAVIGLGNISHRHRKNLRALFPKSCIIVMPTRERNIEPSGITNADKIASNIEELISMRPDAAIVASPATFHIEHALKLVMARIPILIEKPISSNLSKASKFLDVVNQSEVTVAVGYCLRYAPSMQFVKAYIEQDRLGTIYNVSVNVGQLLSDWRPIDYQNSVSANASLGGGVLLELSHELDYLRWLFGDFNVLFSQLRNTRKFDLNVEEIADIVMVNSQGIVFNLHMDFVQCKAQRHCSIIGEKGRLDWDIAQNHVELHDFCSSEVIFEVQDWQSNSMYLKMLVDFFAKVTQKKNDCVAVDDAFRTVELIERIKHLSTYGKKL